MRALGWRVLLVAAFLPLALPWGACELFQVLAAGSAWLLLGPDELRSERILLGPPASWVARPLEYLSDKAGLP